MIVVDASALIAHLDETDALHDRAVDALLAAADQPLGCSPITVTEVLVGPARAGRLGDARNAIAQPQSRRGSRGRGARRPAR